MPHGTLRAAWSQWGFKIMKPIEDQEYAGTGKNGNDVVAHIAACHAEIKRLKGCLVDIADMAISHAEKDKNGGHPKLPNGYFDIFHAATMAVKPDHYPQG